jgi:hypothetical protein
LRYRQAPVTYAYDRLQASKKAFRILHAEKVRLLPEDRVDMRLGAPPRPDLPMECTLRPNPDGNQTTGLCATKFDRARMIGSGKRTCLLARIDFEALNYDLVWP